MTEEIHTLLVKEMLVLTHWRNSKPQRYANHMLLRILRISDYICLSIGQALPTPQRIIQTTTRKRLNGSKFHPNYYNCSSSVPSGVSLCIYWWTIACFTEFITFNLQFTIYTLFQHALISRILAHFRHSEFD